MGELLVPVYRSQILILQATKFQRETKASTETHTRTVIIDDIDTRRFCSDYKRSTFNLGPITPREEGHDNELEDGEFRKSIE